VFEEETSRLGGLDALANIAGMEQQVPAGEIGEGDLDLMVAVHVKGTVFTNQAAFRAMRERGGSGLGGEHRRGAVEKPQRRQGPNIGRHRSRKPPQPAPRVRHLGVDTAPSHSTCVRATPTSVAAPQPLRIEPKWARGDFASRFRSCPRPNRTAESDRHAIDSADRGGSDCPARGPAPRVLGARLGRRNAVERSTLLGVRRVRRRFAALGSGLLMVPRTTTSAPGSRRCCPDRPVRLSPRHRAAAPVVAA
jgi:hypothetical protein